MTVSAAFLVLDPPLDRLAMLIEYLQPVISEAVIVVDDRTAAEAVAIMATWPNVTLVPFTWVDDFAVARSAAIPKAKGDWILHLDPDEMPTAAMMEFIRTVDRTPQYDVDWQGTRYMAPRGYLFFTKNFYDGTQAAELEEHWHCRLFLRRSGWWYKPVHEQVMLESMPEATTRGTPLLPKAPLGAYLIHSRMNVREKDELYAKIGANA
jgi:glycosyltransferase involved in cell wall biosynthesis